jgi:murein DD-endopeptidase MepM/ murein hydrolase activator NlpD
LANVTYTVVKGDTLWAIAQRNNTTVNNLVKLNDISDPDYIVVGQVLIISGTAASSTSSSSSRATIKVFGLQSNSDRTVYATWNWSKSNTENYQVKWYYDTGDGVWFVGTDSTVTVKQSTYNAPSNAKRVKFTVKPVSKKRKINNKETSYWAASWSTSKTYSFSSNPPSAPSGPPEVTIDKYQLTAEVRNLENINATSVQFQIVRNDSSVFKTGTATIKTGVASYSCTVSAGGEYKVRCRTVRGKLYSDWTNYSNNEGTIPYTPAKIAKCHPVASVSGSDGTNDYVIYLEWPAVKNAKTYDIQYTTNKKYFESRPDSVTAINNVEYTNREIHGLKSGEYFFRVRAVNGEGASAWSPIKSTITGEAPSAPTTWSSTTTAIVGEVVTLYWVHNAEDESKQTSARLEITVDNNESVIHTIKNTLDEGDKDADKPSSFVLSTNDYAEGAKIQWRVSTAGVVENEYGEWSVERTIDVHAMPTLELSVTDVDGEPLEALTSYPFYITGNTEPDTQIAIGYHVSITADEAYETVDGAGNTKMVRSGDEVYSRHFDTHNPSEQFELLLQISANSVDLENNVSYTITCTASMNSGLTAVNFTSFSVSWEDAEYEPNAEIGIDEDTLSASIRPYCENFDGELIEDVLLSVYRREFDGGFTEIATDIPNNGYTFVTDPHPALDFARYRIVATSTTVGTVSYYDVPGIPVNEKTIVIQWDEEWKSFDAIVEDEQEQPSWSGSILKLPYNVDVSDNNGTDVELVEYIGRKHPVAYYGTQLGETAMWSVTIEKNDVETLYALRRLRIYTGDVYVREPSGSGYWANIKVSFSQKHCDMTIPVNISLTRVEGGI